MALGSDQYGPHYEDNDHQWQQESGEQECFVPDPGKVFPPGNEPCFVHSVDLSSDALKLAGKGRPFYQPDKNII